MNLQHIINFILPHFFQKGSQIVEKSQVISAHMVNVTRQMMMIVLVSFGALAIFCSSFAISLYFSLKAIDENGHFVWSNTNTVGLVICILAAMTFYFCLRQETWKKVIKLEDEEEEKQKKTESAAHTSPIEEAIGLLIKDFVAERAFKREHGEMNSKEDAHE